MASIEVCKTTDVPLGKCKRINIDGRDPIGVYHLEDGFYAIDDICTHGRALLSAGDIEGDRVVCAFHGGSFDIRSGAPVERPCVVPIKVYDVTVENELVFINIS
tara:strand:- start:982 stop:1293 length:312 start_codon:yes stop_codon:yes gene_type:complete